MYYVKKKLFHEEVNSFFRQLTVFGSLQLPFGRDEGIRVGQDPPHHVLVGKGPTHLPGQVFPGEFDHLV